MLVLYPWGETNAQSFTRPASSRAGAEWKGLSSKFNQGEEKGGEWAPGCSRVPQESGILVRFALAEYSRQALEEVAQDDTASGICVGY